MVSDLICVLGKCALCLIQFSIFCWTYCCYSERMWIGITTKTSRKQKKLTFRRMFGIKLVFVFWFYLLFFGFFVLSSKEPNKLKGVFFLWIKCWNWNGEKQQNNQCFLLSCIYTCVCTNVHVHIYIYTYIYIHTHMYI